MGMPHFYFHIRDGERIIADEEGLDLEDFDAARLEARAGALSMLQDAIANGDDISHQVVEVTDTDGLVIWMFPLHDLLDGPNFLTHP